VVNQLLFPKKGESSERSEASDGGASVRGIEEGRGRASVRGAEDRRIGVSEYEAPRDRRGVMNELIDGRESEQDARTNKRDGRAKYPI
jgi:hypothetical protein